MFLGFVSSQVCKEPPNPFHMFPLPPNVVHGQVTSNLRAAACAEGMLAGITFTRLSICVVHGSSRGLPQGDRTWWGHWPSNNSPSAALQQPFSSRLRYLTFYGGPWTTLPGDICGCNLVVLRINWALSMSSLSPVLAQLAQLRRLELNGLPSLRSLPDLSGLRSLEQLRLLFSAVEALPKSFGKLSALRLLEVVGCKELRHLPISSQGQLSSLEWLLLGKLPCSELAITGLGALREIEIDELDGLTSLRVEGCASLRALTVGRCLGLAEPPRGLGLLTGLEHLCLRGCTSLLALPRCIANLQQLRVLDVTECVTLPELPDSCGVLASLQHLLLKGCKKLQTLPPSVSGLQRLQVLDMRGCGGLQELPMAVGQLVALQSCLLAGCKGLQALVPPQQQQQQQQHQKPQQQQQEPRGRQQQQHLGDRQGMQPKPCCLALPHLMQLDLTGCRLLKTLPLLGGCVLLQQLLLGGTCGAENIGEAIKGLVALEQLDLSSCTQLTALAQLEGLQSLRKLSLQRCSRLQALPNLAQLTVLQELDLEDCLDLVALPEGLHSGIKVLCVMGCKGSLQGQVPEVLWHAVQADAAPAVEVRAWAAQGGEFNVGQPSSSACVPSIADGLYFMDHGSIDAWFRLVLITVDGRRHPPAQLQLHVKSQLYDTPRVWCELEQAATGTLVLQRSDGGVGFRDVDRVRVSSATTVLFTYGA